MWMECFGEDARIEADDAETLEERFLAHASEQHEWDYPEQALRNYARNYGEATVRLTGSTERLDEIGDVAIHPVTEDRIDDWLDFFDHDAFAGDPDWASCYCFDPHLPATDDDPERPWRQVRDSMKERLRNGETFGYLAYVDGKAAGWVNASKRSEYGKYSWVDPAGPDPLSVIGVSCFIVAAPYRHHGLAGMLLDRVVADAPERGALWVEGYPHTVPDDSDAGHFRGPKRSYESRGFNTVEQRENDTVVRRRAAATGKHNTD